MLLSSFRLIPSNDVELLLNALVGKNGGGPTLWLDNLEPQTRKGPKLYHTNGWKYTERVYWSLPSRVVPVKRRRANVALLERLASMAVLPINSLFCLTHVTMAAFEPPIQTVVPALLHC